MRFQRRHDVTGLLARRFQKGISRISGLEEVKEDSLARIWIRGEPHSVEEFLQRVYGVAEEVGDSGENAVENGENGDVGGENSENSGESI